MAISSRDRRSNVDKTFLVQDGRFFCGENLILPKQIRVSVAFSLVSASRPLQKSLAPQRGA
jgi:hypothetical protein